MSFILISQIKVDISPKELQIDEIVRSTSALRGVKGVRGVAATVVKAESIDGISVLMSRVLDLL
jgi:hypothetical protein